MRSLGSPKKTTAEETVTAGEIQMQSFADGAPPPPPVSYSWKKIDRWLENNYLELFDQLGEGCTQNDVNELEHELDCSLPQDVRDSLAIHDGQGARWHTDWRSVWMHAPRLRGDSTGVEELAKGE